MTAKKPSLLDRGVKLGVGRLPKPHAAAVMDLDRIGDESLHEELRHVLKRVSHVLNFTHERTGGTPELKQELQRELDQWRGTPRSAVEALIEERVVKYSHMMGTGWNAQHADPWLHARMYAVAAVIAFERGDLFSCMALANDAVFIFGRDGMRSAMTATAARRRSELAAKGGKSRTRPSPIDPSHLAEFRAMFVQRYGTERGWQKAAATSLGKSDAAISKAWKKLNNDIS